MSWLERFARGHKFANRIVSYRVQLLVVGPRVRRTGRQPRSMGVSFFEIALGRVAPPIELCCSEAGSEAYRRT